MKNVIINLGYKVRSNIISYFVLTFITVFAVGKITPVIVSNSNLFLTRFVCNDASEAVIDSVISERDIRQTFTVPYQYLKGIELQFGTYGRVNHGLLAITLRDKTVNNTVKSWEVDLSLLEDTSKRKFFLEQGFSIDNTHIYEIIIQTDANEDNEIAVYMSNSNQYNEGDLYVDSIIQESDLVFSIYGYNDGYNRLNLFYFFAFILLGIVYYMVYLLVNKRVSNELVSINKFDWIFVSFSIFVSCMIFNQGFDMRITIKHAEDLLSVIKEGKILSFYTIVMEKALNGGYLDSSSILYAANYNIILYLIVAIMIFPLVLMNKLTGFEYSDECAIIFVNMFLSLALILSAYILYRIAREMGQTINGARKTAYLYLSSMLLVYATVGFSQLDIIYVLIMLVALLFYLEKKYIVFSCVMSIAIMLKMFPILVFVPLILLVEKRVLYIAKHMVIALSSTIVFKFIYGADYGYNVTQEKLGSLYGFTGRVFSSGIEVFMGKCALFVVVMVIICLYMYDKKCSDKELWKYVMLVPFIVFASFMALVLWHPQWLTMIAPFMALIVSVHPQRKSFIYIEWGIGILVYIVSALWFPENVDNYMVNNGILKSLTGHCYNGITLRNVLFQFEYSLVVVVSILIALLGYFAFFAIKDTTKMDSISNNDIFYLNRWTVWGRVASVYIYCLILVSMFFFVG